MANAADDVEHGNIQDPTVQFLLHATQKEDKFFPQTPIQMIPTRVRDFKPEAFNPRVVSIGPLHKKDENLLPFEQQKAIFLRDLLLHSGFSQEETLATCVKKVNASVYTIRQYYTDEIMSYSNEEIARMMIMDAGFILQYIYKLSSYRHFDGIIGLERSIFFDLLLIENQIPFFVLRDIFECTFASVKPEKISLKRLISLLFDVVNIFDLDLRIEEDKYHDAHILGLLHKCYQPPRDLVDVISSRSIFETSPSAVELDSVGVNFKPHYSYGEGWAMDIKLESPRWHLPWSKPTLRIPTLFLEDDTELILRNLIAYEQLSPRLDNYITSYITAMDLLINNAEDVTILVKSKVLVNIIGSNNDAAKMINKLGKETPFTEFVYARQWEELDTHYGRYLPKHIEWFRRTYFKSPWNMFALLAGILLFVLTVVQTYYTVNPVQTNINVG